jgi:myo-inositol-1(or 4)-monophosphatase
MTRDDRRHDALRFALALVREVGTRLNDIFQEFGQIRSEQKRDGSLLTAADVEANERIIREIRNRFGEHGILTEEGETAGPAEEFTWIVDPVDGTTNFTWGISLWSVSIALARHGTPLLGVVAFPALNRVYHAVRGEGAFRNDVPITANSPSERSENQIFVACTNTLKRYDLNIPFKLRILGSASYNLVMVAEGKAVGGMEDRPKIWDVAAGQLIIEEAGGIVEYWDGRSFFPFERGTDYRSISLPMITAVDRETCRTLRHGIHPR